MLAIAKINSVLTLFKLFHHIYVISRETPFAIQLFLVPLHSVRSEF